MKKHKLTGPFLCDEPWQQPGDWAYAFCLGFEYATAQAWLERTGKYSNLVHADNLDRLKALCRSGGFYCRAMILETPYEMWAEFAAAAVADDVILPSEDGPLRLDMLPQRRPTQRDPQQLPTLLGTLWPIAAFLFVLGAIALSIIFR